MKEHPIRTIILTALISCATTLALLRWDLVPEYAKSPGGVESPTRADTRTGQPPPGPDEEVNIRVYNKVSPGVVNITSTVVEYGFFFGAVPSKETGSGAVLDLEGHILT